MDLERSLNDLGRRIAWPSTGDVSHAVGAQIRTGPVQAGKRTRRLAYAAVAVVLAAAAALTISPGVRTAVADLLGLGGVRIRTTGPTPTPAETLDLGEPVGLAQARERVDFEVRIPHALGVPDAVFYDREVAGGQVTLAYAPAAGLPAADGTELGALVTQFSGGTPDLEILQKVLASEGTTIEAVEVKHMEGFWISGEPHIIAYLESDGTIRTDTVRLAGNVLLWKEGAVTYRLESRLSKQRALEIAESVE